MVGTEGSHRSRGLAAHHRLLGMLFRQQYLIAATFLLVFGIAAAITLMLPKSYSSSMKLLVKSERADLVVSPDARDNGAFHSEVTETQINSEVALLSSYDLLSKVVRECHLTPVGGESPAQPLSSGESIEKAVAKLRRGLTITPVRKSNIIELAYSAPNPKQAASVLKVLAKTYLDMHLRVHRSEGTQEFFRTQADRYQEQLRTAEQQLSEFCKKNGLTSVGEQKDLLMRKMVESESALSAAQTELAESIKRVANLQKQVAAQDPRMVTQRRASPNQYSLERLNTMLTELENRRTEALVKFRPEDRLVVELNDQIANTRAALNQAAAQISTEQVTDVNPLHSALETDLAREQLREAGLKVRRDSLSSTYSDNRARLAQIEGDTLEYDNLKRAVKEAEENYILYSRKQEEARIADSLDQQKMANVAVAEAPVEHYMSTKPRVGLSLFVGGLLASLVGLSVGLGLEYSRGRMHSPAEVEFATGIPVLASIGFRRR